VKARKCCLKQQKRYNSLQPINFQVRNLGLTRYYLTSYHCFIKNALPYFPANKPTRRISRGQFLALKMRVFPYYRLISRISKFGCPTTGTFFSFCNKVCQVCVTFITHQRMFFTTTVKLIPLALLIAVAVILFALLSSFTRQCIYRKHVQKTKCFFCVGTAW